MRGSRTATQTVNVNDNIIYNNVDNSAGTNISLNTTNGKITLTAGNTYRLIGSVPNFSGSRPSFTWYNETAGANIGSAVNGYSPSESASNGSMGGIAEVIITPNVNTVVYLKLVSVGNSTSTGSISIFQNGDFLSGNGYPWFEAQVISGNAPVTGESVDYVSVMLTTDQSNSSAGQNVKFQTIQSGNIPYDASTGNFSLTAGKTYRLTALASLNGTSPAASALDIIWRTADGVNIGPIGSLINASSNINFSGQGVVDVIYTPTRNITVSLYISYVGNSTTVLRSYSTNATITQIGSSAIVNPWVLSGNNVYNTTGNVGIGTNAPAATLDVNGTANATTLNLTNATIGTPSLVLKNGDAAASYSDIAQIKMGWSGSAAGKSQYAQFIHSRHNSGATNNAIDFYLSDGTADNTITTGSTKAMSLESPGNLTLAGKLNLTDPSGSVATKAAAFVNAGVAVTLGEIQVQMASSGSRSLQIKTTGSNFAAMVSAYTSYNGASGTNAYTYFSDYSQTVSATYGYIGTTWSFGNEGDLANYFVRDLANQRFWRITLMVGPSYNNNFITIERLL